MVTHEQLAERLDKGAEQFARISTALARIETTLGSHGTLLEKIDGRVVALEASENRRIGRDGVIAAILRSPFVAWLTGIVAAVGAYFAGTGASGGQ